MPIQRKYILQENQNQSYVVLFWKYLHGLKRLDMNIDVWILTPIRMECEPFDVGRYQETHHKFYCTWMRHCVVIVLTWDLLIWVGNKLDCVKLFVFSIQNADYKVVEDLLVKNDVLALRSVSILMSMHWLGLWVEFCHPPNVAYNN